MLINAFSLRKVFLSVAKMLAEWLLSYEEVGDNHIL